MPRGKKAQSAGENPAVVEETTVVEEVAVEAPAAVEDPPVVKADPRAPAKVKICNPTYAGMTVSAQNVVAQFDKNGVAELTDEESALFLRVPGYSIVE